MKTLWCWTVAITAIPVAFTGVLSSAQASSPAASALASIPAAVPAAVPASTPSSLSYSQIRTELVTASRALTDAQEDVTAARSDSRAATIAVAEANKDIASAEKVLAQALRVLDLTSSSATAAQQQLDDRARTRYHGGGDAPGLSDVLLTSTDTGSLTQALADREFLKTTSQTAAAGVEASQRAVAQAEASVDAREADVALARATADAAELNRVAAEAAVQEALDAVDDARSYVQKLVQASPRDNSRDYRKIERCGDWLTKLLARVGFEDENLREAWAIVMRESGGNEDAISVTNDLGLFQINTFAWGGQDW
ncbi:MAG: transglycosylase SLT domain-containing protein, partial [Actinomycetales bacterium]|nr:transglycosylase SLT domain-containing protein [Actinomycetales bacterium]